MFPVSDSASKPPAHDPLPERLIALALALVAIPCLFVCVAVFFFGWPFVAALFR
jgi:hypothetical protein